MKWLLTFLILFACGCQTANQEKKNQTLTIETAKTTYISEYAPDGIKLDEALELLGKKVEEQNPNLSFNYSLYRLHSDPGFGNPTVSIELKNLSLYHILDIMSQEYAWGWWIENGTYYMNMQSISYEYDYSEGNK